MLSPCKSCGRPCLPVHHKYPQHKRARKVYKELLDDPWNREHYCDACHSGHRNIKREDMWDEERFREEAKKRGYVLPEPLRSYKC